MSIRDYLETTLRKNGWKVISYRKNSKVWGKNNCRVQIDNYDTVWINNSDDMYSTARWTDKKDKFEEIDTTRLFNEGFYTKDNRYFSLTGEPSAEERKEYQDTFWQKLMSDPAVKEAIDDYLAYLKKKESSNK